MPRRGPKKRSKPGEIQKKKDRRYVEGLVRQRLIRHEVARIKELKSRRHVKRGKRLKTPTKRVKRKQKRRKNFTVWKTYDGFILYRQIFTARGEIAAESAKKITIDAYDYGYIIRHIPKTFSYYSLQIKVSYRKGASTWLQSTSGIVGYMSYENFTLDFHKWLRVAVASIMGRMAGRLHYPKFILRTVTIIGWLKRN